MRRGTCIPIHCEAQNTNKLLIFPLYLYVLGAKSNLWITSVTMTKLILMLINEGTLPAQQRAQGKLGLAS